MKSLQGRCMMNAEQHQTATDPWTKPTDLSHWPAFRQLWNYIHHRHHYYSAHYSNIETWRGRRGHQMTAKMCWAMVADYTQKDCRIRQEIIQMLPYHFPSFFHYNPRLSKCILTGFLSTSSRHLSVCCR